ncbi:MAG TPA: hypothetical protein VM534_08950 [Thermoanaerobaculia bacterium]|nr:hypothetical protein [Thermoanaerobaculia bacterium]
MDERERGWPWDAGLRWALVMATLQLLETLVLMEIVFSDEPHSGLRTGQSLVHAYFGVVATSFLVQLTGIILVVNRRYRLGGALQIFASCFHLLKIEGVIGIIGGVKAWKFTGTGSEPSVSGEIEVEPERA